MVATGAVAGAAQKILRLVGCALALARGDRDSCTNLPLSPTLSVASALLLALLLTVVAGAVALGGTPAPPASGSLLALPATVAGLGMARAEPAVAALE